VRGVALELLEKVLRRSAEHVVDLLDLVELVRTREERKETEDLEPNAASTPEVHLVGVISVRQEALRSAIPARGDVLGVRLFRVDPAAGAKVRELQLIVHH
jgi:hypothetical protein